MSQASSAGDERAKHQAARIKKIVVGISGTNAPMKPSANIRNPRQRKNVRVMASPRLSRRVETMVGYGWMRWLAET
jgi:hypothetical protein